MPINTSLSSVSSLYFLQKTSLHSHQDSSDQSASTSQNSIKHQLSHGNHHNMSCHGIPLDMFQPLQLHSSRFNRRSAPPIPTPTNGSDDLSNAILHRRIKLETSPTAYIKQEYIAHPEVKQELPEEIASSIETIPWFDAASPKLEDIPLRHTTRSLSPIYSPTSPQPSVEEPMSAASSPERVYGPFRHTTRSLSPIYAPTSPGPGEPGYCGGQTPRPESMRPRHPMRSLSPINSPTSPQSSIEEPFSTPTSPDRGHEPFRQERDPNSPIYAPTSPQPGDAGYHAVRAPTTEIMRAQTTVPEGQTAVSDFIEQLHEHVQQTREESPAPELLQTRAGLRAHRRLPTEERAWVRGEARMYGRRLLLETKRR